MNRAITTLMLFLTLHIGDKVILNDSGELGIVYSLNSEYATVLVESDLKTVPKTSLTKEN